MSEGQRFKRGDVVLYKTGHHIYSAVVDSEPWTLGGGHKVVNLAGLGPEYQWRVVNRTRVNAAWCYNLVLAPVEFVEGEWCYPTDDSDPSAYVFFAFEPSPETGHVGWSWWALGRMGEACSYEQAKEKAVEELQRRMDNIIAVM